MRTPNLIVLFSIVLLVSVVVFTGCSDDDDPASSNLSWQIVFEDNFDGDELNTTNWTQPYDTHPPYSLTGSGELEIEGEAGDHDGALFLYNTAVTGNYVRVTTQFRTTQKDPDLDEVDMAILLNYDSAHVNAYYLSLSGDEFQILKITSSAESVLRDGNLVGTQISADNDYILEGTNSNGTITFAIKNGDGVVLKSISVEDSSYSGGQIGIGGDGNIATTAPQSVFFNYVIVEKYQ